MQNLITKFKQLSKGVIISEVIYALSIFLYLYMLSGGGLFTSYFSFMAMIIVAAITAVYLLFFKKNYIVAIVNLVIAAGIFIQFASMAP